ncbi:MAG: hypothetical protein Q8S13_03770, partial [Dehalococcoidia bacterium]|nr:hypothetical protein [Dehalococcoidia bacterium]
MPLYLRGRVMRLLHLVPKRTHDERMSRDRFLQVEAVARQGYVHHSGPGWPDWILGSTAGNIDALVKAHEPDLILVYDLVLGKLPAGAPPTCVVIKEGYKRQKVQEVIEANDARLVIFQHRNVLE